MSEAFLLLIYIIVIFALPFGIAFALRIYAEKWGDNKEAEPSETSNSYDYSSSDNNSGKSSNYKHTYKYSKRTYRPWEDEKKVVFRKQEGGFILLDWTNYKATCSIIALFSMVIRKDGSIGEQEMKVARLYFDNHPVYNYVLSNAPKKGWKDPISNTSYSCKEDCMEILKHYNSCQISLQYEKCCQYIKEAGIYYTATFDLIKALCQVAYSSDGVIDSEEEILSGLAKELNIRHEGWINLMRLYGMGKDTRQKGKNESSKQKNREKNDNAHKQEKKRSDEQQKNQRNQGNQKKSSTFGYKLTQAYNKLGLLTTASEAEVKEAFRILAKKYHPDRLPPEATDQERKISADQFRMVKEAYDLIRLERGR